MKNSYLAVYDYGMGDIWTVVHARSKEEIVQKYPLLIVKDVPPNWMTDQQYNATASSSSFDIDDEPPDWLVSAMIESSSR